MGCLKIILVNICLIVAAHAVCDKSGIPNLDFKLSGTNLDFPCDSTKNIYLQTGRYLQKNVIITRFLFYKESAIVAMPRYRPGVPFTLAKFPLSGKDSRPSLAPFPCWSMQEEGNCDALQNAIDIFLDLAGIIWVLDSGMVNTLEQPVRRCPPKVVGINARTGQVVKVIDLSPFVVPSSALQSLVVDYDCDGNAYIYITDAGASAIIVYDIFGNKGYRVVLPKAVTSGCSCKSGLDSALIRKPTGNLLYFTYLTASNLYYIKASALQKGQSSGAVVDVGPKPGGKQIVLLGTDNGSALFFRYKGESDIYIWNTVTCFKSDNFVLVQKGGEYTLATQVVPGYKRLMWVLESNFQDYIGNSVGCLGASINVHPLVKTCD